MLYNISKFMNSFSVLAVIDEFYRVNFTFIDRSR
jgi:hypothetical protein